MLLCVSVGGLTWVEVVSMASSWLTALTAMLCIVIFVRLFTYRRNGAGYRWGKSVVAFAVMIACGRLLIEVLTSGLVVPLEFWPFVLLLGVFALAVVRAEGNVARLVQPGDLPWSGVERRRGGRG